MSFTFLLLPSAYLSLWILMAYLGGEKHAIRDVKNRHLQQFMSAVLSLTICKDADCGSLSVKCALSCYCF